MTAARWQSDAAGTDPPEVVPARRRGRVLAVATLVAAIVTAAVLGAACFLTLDAINIVSMDPIGGALGWALVAGAAAVTALVLVPVAVVVLLYARPRTVAALALVASLVLPPAVVALAAPLGADRARARAATDLAIQGGVADRTVDLLATWDVDAGPVRDLLRAILAVS